MITQEAIAKLFMQKFVSGLRSFESITNTDTLWEISDLIDKAIDKTDEQRKPVYEALQGYISHLIHLHTDYDSDMSHYVDMMDFGDRD